MKQDLNLMEQRQIWRCVCLEERVAKGGQGIGCERGDESFMEMRALFVEEKSKWELSGGDLQ